MQFPAEVEKNCACWLMRTKIPRKLEEIAPEHIEDNNKNHQEIVEEL